MGNLRTSLPAKVAALFLAVLLAITAAASCAGVALGVNIGLYWHGDASDALAHLSENDPFYFLFVNLLYPMKSVLPWIAVNSVLALCADLVFLCCAAGHRKDSDAVLPNHLDRIPLDLYLFLALLTVSVPISLWVEAQPLGDGELYLLALLLPLLPLLVVGLATMMTLATRIKLGHVFANTLTFRLICLLWRTCRRFWQFLNRFVRSFCRGVRELFLILPMTYRAILLTAGLMFIQSFLACSGVYDGFFTLLLFLLDAAILLVVAALFYQLQKLKAMGQRLANGELDAKIDTRRMLPDIKIHAENLNAISLGMNRAVEQRMKSERLKTELITNVSHDIKTPLTSIVNYVDLLKKEPLPEKASQYLIVLDRQSKRLKKLTEDLVEASRASTGNISVSLQSIVVNEIIHQAVGDYDQRLTAGKIEVIINTFEGNLSAVADGRLLWRVLDNLLSNVCKYAMAGSRLYIDLNTAGNRVSLSMKNISRDPLNISADELTERFVRGDSSRHTEGSGLGLNIAKSLMELMGGTFQIAIDGDLFKAELTLPLSPPLPAS